MSAAVAIAAVAVAVAVAPPPMGECGMTHQKLLLSTIHCWIIYYYIFLVSTSKS